MLAIIVVTYKNNARTIQFVQQELSKIKYSHKVIIVNNGATDESNNELCETLLGFLVKEDEKINKRYGVFVIGNPDNSGFAKGNNMGARFAKAELDAEYLLFSNNDIILSSPNVVEALVSKLKADRSIGIIGPSIVGLDGKHQSPEPFISFWDHVVWMYLSKFFLNKEERAKRFRFNYSELAKEGEHYKLMGSFFMVRTDDYLKCGMMDENTFLFAEEPILTERMKKIGLKPYFCPVVTVIHVHGDTTKKHLNNKIISEIQYKSERYYYKHYIGTPKWQLLIGDLFQKIYRRIK